MFIFLLFYCFTFSDVFLCIPLILTSVEYKCLLRCLLFTKRIGVQYEYNVFRYPAESIASKLL